MNLSSIGIQAKSIQKHGVDTESAEQIFHNRDLLVPLGIQTSPKVNEPRFGVLGTDYTGKRLSSCFIIRDGRIRVISIRPMGRSERTMYEQALR